MIRQMASVNVVCVLEARNRSTRNNELMHAVVCVCVCVCVCVRVFLGGEKATHIQMIDLQLIIYNLS